MSRFPRNTKSRPGWSRPPGRCCWASPGQSRHSEHQVGWLDSTQLNWVSLWTHHKACILVVTEEKNPQGQSSEKSSAFLNASSGTQSSEKGTVFLNARVALKCWKHEVLCPYKCLICWGPVSLTVYVWVNYFTVCHCKIVCICREVSIYLHSCWSPAEAQLASPSQAKPAASVLLLLCCSYSQLKMREN